MGQITSNAVAYAAFRTAGGLKKTSYIAIAYAVLVLGFMFVALALNPLGHAQVFGGTARFLLGIQTFLLGGYACAAVVSIIQKDTTSRMMESHRLMPVDPRLVVLGYMFGAASPVVMISAFNFVAGGMLAGAAGLPIDWWVASNIVIATFSIFAWSLAAAGAFFHTLLGFALLVPLALVTISGGAAGMIIPPVLMLASPCLGTGIWNVQPVDGDSVMLLAMSLVLQAAVGALFVQMGARRFKIADAPAMSGRMGVMLTALLALAGAIIVNYEGTVTPILRHREPTVMVVGTLITLLIVASAAVAHHVAEQQTLGKVKRSVLTDVALIAALCACVAGFALVTPEKLLLVRHTIWTAAETALALTAVLLWSRLMIRSTAGIVGLVAMLLVFAFVPIVLGLVWASSRLDLSTEAQVICQLSPMMMIPAIWTQDLTGAGIQPQAASMVVQAVLLLVPAGLLWRRQVRGMNPMLKPV